MSILRPLASFLIALAISAAAQAQMPPAGPSWLDLEIAGEIDVYQMPLTRDDGQNYDRDGRFYYARYVDGALEAGSLERAKSAIFGVYFYAGGTSRWVIRPEWSGLFPVNSDYAIVRKPGKDEWLTLQIDKGKTSKIGRGEMRVMDVLHREATAYESADPVYRYYLSANDTGETQTVSFLRWNNDKKRIETAEPVRGVLSPSNEAGLVPLQLTYGLDIIMRSRLASGGIQEQVIPSVRWGSGKIDRFVPRPANQGPFVFTAPSRLLLKVLDGEQQLYLPYLSVSNSDDVLRANNPKFDGFLGVRPIGDQVTADLRPNPLYQHAEAGFAALWQTGDGVRLAPVPGGLRASCFDTIYDKSLCSVGQVEQFFSRLSAPLRSGGIQREGAICCDRTHRRARRHQVQDIHRHPYSGRPARLSA